MGGSFNYSHLREFENTAVFVASFSFPRSGASESLFPFFFTGFLASSLIVSPGILPVVSLL